MRSRLNVALSLLMASALGAAAGCGNITLGPEEGNDLSATADMAVILSNLDLAGTDGSSGPITPVIAAAPDLVGFPTKLDGTRSTDQKGRTLSYLWHVVSTPAGSNVADSCAPTGGFSTCLSSTTDPQPSFEPDRGGDYTVRLTVTAGAQKAMATLTFTVPTVPVFFSQGNSSVTAVNTALDVVRSDGTGLRDVSCRQNSDGGFYAGNAQNVLFSWLFTGVYDLRTFTPSSGAAGVAFMNIDNFTNFDSRLYYADENATCASGVTRIDDPTPSARSNMYFRLAPRFAPDGTRVLYLDLPQNFSSGSNRIVTVGTDGGSVHVVSTAANIFPQTAPVWLDQQNVLWVQNDAASGPAHLQIYKAADASAPTATVLVDCTNKFTLIHQLEVISTAPYAFLIAASTDPITDQQNPSDQTIDLYKIDSSCRPTNLTGGPKRAWSRDFALAPDGNTVAYSSTADTAAPDSGASKLTYDIWTLTIDGTVAPHKFVGVPDENDFGPHWTAGGRQLVWTQTSIGPDGFNADAGLSGSGVNIVNADGTHKHSLHGEHGNPDAGEGSLGGSSLGAIGCSVAGELSDLWHALIGGGVAALLLMVLARLRGRRNHALPADR